VKTSITQAFAEAVMVRIKRGEHYNSSLMFFLESHRNRNKHNRSTRKKKLFLLYTYTSSSVELYFVTTQGLLFLDVCASIV